jgi:hypothetical protein
VTNEIPYRTDVMLHSLMGSQACREMPFRQPKNDPPL